MFALLVGIDDYLHMPKLKACIKDIKAMREWLTSAYPPNKLTIEQLANQEATRAAILTQLVSLATRPDIEQDEPILVYFSGHGTQGKIPPAWLGDEPVDDQGNKVELLCPYDIKASVDGRIVHGIPDRTLAVLLRRIAKSKGNNITIILDCCCSGSGTRVQNTMEPTEYSAIRCVPLDIPIPTDLDRDICQDPRHGRLYIEPTFQHALSKSHILLAACKQAESALELESGGVFTTNLLRCFRELGIPNQRTTYNDLQQNVLQRMDGKFKQHPQCEGDNTWRFLFSLEGVDGRSFDVTKQGDGKLRVHAGQVQGILPGTEFIICGSGILDDGSQAVFTAKDVRPTYSYVNVNGGPPDSDRFRVVVRKSGCYPTAYTVHFSTSSATPALESIFPLAQSRSSFFASAAKLLCLDAPRSLLANTEEDESGFVFKRVKSQNAWLVIEGDPLQATLKSTHSSMRHPIYHFPLDDKGELWHRLQRAARFDFHLHRKEPETSRIEVQLFRLKPGERQPSGKNLIVGGRARCRDEAKYALVIHNRSKVPLWPFLFYFDPSKLSIHPIYSPVSRDTSPLAAGGSVQIGRSSECEEPLEFCLEGDEKEDTGFLKVFAADRYVDMTLPFVESEEPASEAAEAACREHGEKIRTSEKPRAASDVDGMWFTAVAQITVTEFSMD